MYSFFLFVFIALAASVEIQKGNSFGSWHLWYNSPGTDFRSSLPIGNGRLGALVQGSISEKIIINENSVWSGPFQDRTNPGSLEGFPKARKLLTENNYTGAAGTGEISNYESWLDTLSGNTGVSYDVNGVTYTREVVANFPLGVIAARFTASKKGSLSMDVSLERDRGVISNVAIEGAKNITMDIGGSGADAIPFTAGLRVVSYDDFEFDGKWTSGPSTSPENVFVIPKGGSKAGSKEFLDISITMDNSLLREFFSNVIEAAGILGIDLSTDKVLSKVKGYRDGLRPTQIGARGQIQEWRKDYTEAEPGHRHYPHLVDLFPAKAMSPLLNKTLANAAQKSIELRLAAGGASTGWSRVWTAALYARLLNGDKAYDNIQTLLGRHRAPNLFHNIEPGQAFQIDSNFGLVAAVAETLVQSQAGVVHILPALGSQVKTGSVSGLVARGGFQVFIVWRDGLLVEAKVKSRLGNTLKLRVSGGLRFKIDGKGVDEQYTM
ncbi:Alpha-L-fucosidase 2 [Fusarium agapanthi]|uniref:Alpha-L-fucosidase 2 n=1 Tax=Fusarium agapanthi TaxID=1803897 RepID=A0A9P5BBT8_9HYPO|nr:Alpha-L-fucosidase 2 [Fusarium agapanthi]